MYLCLRCSYPPCMSTAHGPDSIDRAPRAGFSTSCSIQLGPTGLSAREAFLACCQLEKRCVSDFELVTDWTSSKKLSNTNSNEGSG